MMENNQTIQTPYLNGHTHPHGAFLPNLRHQHDQLAEKKSPPGMVAHAHKSHTTGQGRRSPGPRSRRPAWAAQRDPVSRKKRKEKKKSLTPRFTELHSVHFIWFMGISASRGISLLTRRLVNATPLKALIPEITMPGFDTWYVRYWIYQSGIYVEVNYYVLILNGNSE